MQVTQTVQLGYDIAEIKQGVDVVQDTYTQGYKAQDTYAPDGAV